MTKYLALFLGFACLMIAIRLTVPLSPESLAAMSTELIANTVFARNLGAVLFALLSIGMILGFYLEMKRR